jgi:hypothetical protein
VKGGFHAWFCGKGWGEIPQNDPIMADKNGKNKNIVKGF